MAELVTPDRHRTPAAQPSLSFEPEQGGGWCVKAIGLGSHIGAMPHDRLKSLLRVRVADDAGFASGEIPDVSGSYDVLDGRIRFVPHFPFQAGVAFRAMLDPGASGPQGPVLTHEFSLPRNAPATAPDVMRIYPSADVLPENLLRFYVRFSTPMRRGCAEANVNVLDSSGRCVPDVLYRAPVELWDRGMTCLTVLLDPGRLKRGVGPNRMLGAPLKAGQSYTLRINAGMTDAHGLGLREGFDKPFRVAEAGRDALAIETWRIDWPAAGSLEPVAVTFPQPLDWAQLWREISIASDTGDPVDGRIDVDMNETRWRFVPNEPWQAGAYQVRVSPTLEDVCGNTTGGPFDGPIRSPDAVTRETAIRSVTFLV